MSFLKYIFLIYIFCGSLYSQIKININQVIDLPFELTKNGFHPTNLNVSATGFYFLDKENRQIAFLSSDENIIYSGGYGTDYDAFIDPIEILSLKLNVWIVDRAENKVTEFDHKLNYLRTIKYDDIYPDFCGIDDWGNMLLQSELEQKIVKSNLPIEKFTDFIDLSLWQEINNCILDMHVSSDGSVGLLTSCSEYVYIFNRLGNLDKKYPLDISDGKWIIKLNNKWYIISENGQFWSIQNNESTKILVEDSILDITQLGDSLYLLFSDKIWMVDVSMD